MKVIMRNSWKYCMYGSKNLHYVVLKFTSQAKQMVTSPLCELHFSTYPYSHCNLPPVHQMPSGVITCSANPVCKIGGISLNSVDAVAALRFLMV